MVAVSSMQASVAECMLGNEKDAQIFADVSGKACRFGHFSSPVGAGTP
jgi:hypothetical protein